MNARHMAEVALVTLTCCAGAAAIAARVLVYGTKAAARGVWKRAMRRLYRQAMHQAARDAGLVPALACRTAPWEPAPEPATPPPPWASTSTPSPADLTLIDHHTRRDLVRPLEDRRRQR